MPGLHAAPAAVITNMHVNLHFVDVLSEQAVQKESLLNEITRVMGENACSGVLIIPCTDILNDGTRSRWRVQAATAEVVVKRVLKTMPQIISVRQYGKPKSVIGCNPQELAGSLRRHYFFGIPPAFAAHVRSVYLPRPDGRPVGFRRTHIRKTGERP